jgi:hypothetical protein
MAALPLYGLWSDPLGAEATTCSGGLPVMAEPFAEGESAAPAEDDPNKHAAPDSARVKATTAAKRLIIILSG